MEGHTHLYLSLLLRLHHDLELPHPRRVLLNEGLLKQLLTHLLVVFSHVQPTLLGEIIAIQVRWSHLIHSGDVRMNTADMEEAIRYKAATHPEPLDVRRSQMIRVIRHLLGSAAVHRQDLQSIWVAVYQGQHRDLQYVAHFAKEKPRGHVRLALAYQIHMCSVESRSDQRALLIHTHQQQ